MLRSAKWRKGPASEGQKVLVAKRYGKMSEGPDGSQNLVQLTKGQAGNIITRLKHGAKVGMHCPGRDHTLTFIESDSETPRRQIEGCQKSNRHGFKRVAAKGTRNCASWAIAAMICPRRDNVIILILIMDLANGM